jgi:5-methyltetrahydropteroyltriglutamate--homocysteine methyltransferase
MADFAARHPPYETAARLPGSGARTPSLVSGSPAQRFLGFVERIVAAINTALVNIPREQVRLHVCWGNYEGPHDCDVPLADILPILYQAKVGAFFLPFAHPRHAHEYKLFEKMPLAEDQILVASVIDSLTNFVEHPEAVADRLEHIAQIVGDPHRVIAGTDCGFDTSAGMGRVVEDVVWAKLKSLAEGARLASHRLGMRWMRRKRFSNRSDPDGVMRV